MTNRLIIILFLNLVCSTRSIGQVNAVDNLENCRGTLITPVDQYTQIHDIDYRRSQYTFDRMDSTLSFITDKTCKVRAACEGKVISIEHDKDNSYFLITRIADYFFCYSRLAKPFVKVGDKVQAGQKLAKLTKGRNEKDYQLDFAIYTTDKDSNLRCLNAYKWLKQ